MAIRSWFLVALIVLCGSAPPWAAAAQPAGERWALLVGIDRYEDEGISRLAFAVADARSAAEALVAKEIGFRRDRVFLMTSDAAPGTLDRPSRANVVKRLDGLAAKIGPNDTFVFYFSGHGYQREGGRNYLGTMDADPRSMQALEGSTLPLGILREKMARIRAHRVLFVIDACRNDPEQSRSLGDNRLTAAFARDLVVVANAAGSGLAGTAILFACSAGERAYEWNEKRHGVFTYYLLDGMRGRAADASGRLTVSGLGEYVQKRVMAWAEERGKTQRPDLYQQGAAAIDLALFKAQAGAGAPVVVSLEPPAATRPAAASDGPPRVAVILPVEHDGRALPDSPAETELIQQLLKAGFRVVDQMHYAERRQALAEDVARDLKVVPRVAQQVGADILIVGQAASEKGEGPAPGFFSCQARVTARVIAAQTAEILASDSASAAGAYVTEMAAANKALVQAARKLTPKLLEALNARRAP